jgi:hypothetical protein
MRTTEDFIQWRDVNFRRQVTPLVNIRSLDFVHYFILDYMHLECLGVMRSMILNMWYKGDIPHLSTAQIETLSCHLIELQRYIPTEFARKSRKIDIILR